MGNRMNKENNNIFDPNYHFHTNDYSKVLSSYLSILKTMSEFLLVNDLDVDIEGSAPLDDISLCFPDVLDISQKKQIVELVMSIKFEVRRYSLGSEQIHFSEILLYPLDNVSYTYMIDQNSLEKFLDVNTELFLEKKFRMECIMYIHEVEKFFKFDVDQIKKLKKKN